MTVSKTVVLPLDDTPSHAETYATGNLALSRKTKIFFARQVQNCLNLKNYYAAGLSTAEEKSMPHNALQSPRIIRNLLPRHKRKTPPNLSEDIPFGRVHTDHMLVCDFIPHKGGWQTPEIIPYGPFQLNPDAVVFHYGQQIFEGMKAYRTDLSQQDIFLFRPDQNAKRFAHSARQLGMEPVPEELFERCVKELVAVDADWILPSPGALYIRPTLIPLDEGVSYRASQTYRFFVILSPAKNYYAREVGVKVYIERERVRAVRGGVGDTKCGGNYAGALSSLVHARSMGAEQVLWLDALEHKFVEEVGAMNVIFVYGNTLITPALGGSILPGITRDSLITLAKSLNYEVKQEPVDINKVLSDAKSGVLSEIFGCGTAAVISPIDALIDGNETILINHGKLGECAAKLKQALTDIQTGLAPDTFNWRVKISTPPTAH